MISKGCIIFNKFVKDNKINIFNKTIFTHSFKPICILCYYSKKSNSSVVIIWVLKTLHPLLNVFKPATKTLKCSLPKGVIKVCVVLKSVLSLKFLLSQKVPYSSWHKVVIYLSYPYKGTFLFNQKLYTSFYFTCSIFAVSLIFVNEISIHKLIKILRFGLHYFIFYLQF